MPIFDKFTIIIIDFSYEKIANKMSWRSGERGLVKFDPNAFGSGGWVLLDLQSGTNDPSKMIRYFSKSTLPCPIRARDWKYVPQGEDTPLAAMASADIHFETSINKCEEIQITNSEKYHTSAFYNK